MTTLDTENKFMVCARASGHAVLIGAPPLGDIDKRDALLLAAWLVALADPLGKEFPKVLEAVQNT